MLICYFALSLHVHSFIPEKLSERERERGGGGRGVVGGAGGAGGKEGGEKFFSLQPAEKIMRL